MSRLPAFRLVSGVVVALLGLLVLACSWMNVGYFADLGETARRLGDDGTVGSLLSFAAGVLLVALGAVGAGTAFLVPDGSGEAAQIGGPGLAQARGPGRSEEGPDGR